MLSARYLRTCSGRGPFAPLDIYSPTIRPKPTKEKNSSWLGAIDNFAVWLAIRSCRQLKAGHAGLRGYVFSTVCQPRGVPRTPITLSAYCVNHGFKSALTEKPEWQAASPVDVDVTERLQGVALEGTPSATLVEPGHGNR